MVADGYPDYRACTPDKFSIHVSISFDDGNTWEDLGDVTETHNAESSLVLIGGGELRLIYADMDDSDL